MGCVPEKPRYVSAGLSIDPLRPDDLPVFMEMMGELAVALGARGWFINPEENLHAALFSEPPRMEAILVRYKDEPAGFASWFETYEVLSGRLVMWFDYFYTRPQFRTRPIMPAMLLYLLKLAKDRKYLYVEGTVQEWNKEALTLYQLLKAEEVEHRLFRLDVSQIHLPRRL
jgi:GNAT superfamily N-acetyltransferase